MGKGKRKKEEVRVRSQHDILVKIQLLCCAVDLHRMTLIRLRRLGICFESDSFLKLCLALLLNKTCHVRARKTVEV